VEKDSWEITCGLDEINQVAQAICSSLGDSQFCLWLQGDLGAGKTTLTGRILKTIGLNERVPVTSPTYTYMNDYEINGSKYAHLDLYRASDGFSPEDIGLVDVLQYQGYFVEWPEQIPNNPFLKATHKLAISYAGDEFRTYKFIKIGSGDF